MEFAEEQSETILILKEQNQILRDEIARLKNQKPKPKIKPSKLTKDNDKKSPKEFKAKPKKKKKTAELTAMSQIWIQAPVLPTTKHERNSINLSSFI